MNIIGNAMRFCPNTQKCFIGFKMKIGIYKITSPTGKIYIGQSVDIPERLSAYKNLKCVNQPKIFASISKHGWAKHTFEVVQFCNREELNDLERHYISQLKSMDRDIGMNLQSGGNSKYEIAESTKQKLREHNLGKKLSPETKRKIADGNRGKNVSEETRRNISKALTGKKMSEERKAKMKGRPYWPLTQDGRDRISKAHLGMKRPAITGIRISIAKKFKHCEGDNKKSKPIIQLTKENIVVRHWTCSIAVKNALGFSSPHINECCNGKRKTSNGFKWEFA
jgi:group I intron endonuclease